MQYDIIGDIHGHAGKLRALLGKLGYREQQGAWRLAGHQAIFVGDLIDRGPEQANTVDIVRRMIEAGSARAIMGNHELNAIAWSMEDPGSPGTHLRPHIPKNRNQHQAFLDQIEGSPRHGELIDWFLTLPLWIELGGLRIVHACWHAPSIDLLTPLLGPGTTMTRALMVDASRRGHPVYEAVEVLLKGPETSLPTAAHYHDKDGALRKNARTRWWLTDPLSLREYVLMPDHALRERVPDEPFSPAHVYDGQQPVAFGHYWMTGAPARQSELAACVDYSAGKGGPLVAYRWEGEPAIRNQGFVSTGP